MRRSVEGVLLLQNRQHPHVLLLQQGTRESAVFRLPGGRLRPGEGELEGARRKLSSKLAPPREQLSAVHQAKWIVEEQLAVWWRPNFETLMCTSHASLAMAPASAPTLVPVPAPPAVRPTPAQVPLPSGACDQAQGVQEDLHGATRGADGLRSPKKLQAARRAAVRAVRQRGTLRASDREHPAPDLALRFRLRRPDRPTAGAGVKRGTREGNGCGHISEGKRT